MFLESLVSFDFLIILCGLLLFFFGPYFSMKAGWHGKHSYDRWREVLLGRVCLFVGYILCLLVVAATVSAAKIDPSLANSLSEFGRVAQVWSPLILILSILYTAFWYWIGWTYAEIYETTLPA